MVLIEVLGTLYSTFFKAGEVVGKLGFIIHYFDVLLTVEIMQRLEQLFRFTFKVTREICGTCAVFICLPKTVFIYSTLTENTRSNHPR